MTIKDFKVGQTAFVVKVEFCFTQQDRFSITETEVVKVGKKYVTISGNWTAQFKEACESRPYLVEHKECGAPRLLFPSREAMDDYIESEELKFWIRTAVGWDKIDHYSLEQLRAVRKILEGEDEV